MSVHEPPQITAYSSLPKTMFEHLIVEFSKSFSEHIPVLYEWHFNLWKIITDYRLRQQR